MNVVPLGVIIIAILKLKENKNWNGNLKLQDDNERMKNSEITVKKIIVKKATLQCREILLPRDYKKYRD